MSAVFLIEGPDHSKPKHKDRLLGNTRKWAGVQTHQNDPSEETTRGDPSFRVTSSSGVKCLRGGNGADENVAMTTKKRSSAVDTLRSIGARRAEMRP
ncbi:unnamed protein product [Gadus morhua 'NCC']